MGSGISRLPLSLFQFFWQEKRGLRELRVLENLKKTIFETNESILPKCEQSMHDNLNEVFQRCKQVTSYWLCCIILRDGINSLDSKYNLGGKLPPSGKSSCTYVLCSHFSEILKGQ